MNAELFAPTSWVDLQPLHTFHLPAQAGALHRMQSLDDLHRFALAWQAGGQHVLLGEGSNTVFLNDMPETTVWQMALKGKQYLGCEGGVHRLRVMGGENWHTLVEWTIAQGWPGLENLALIPGSVGAAPVQNIGAYGVELKDRLEAVEVFDLQTCTLRTLSLAECAMSYRDSVFKRELAGQVVIVAVHFALPVQWQPILGYGDLAQRATQLAGKSVSGAAGVAEVVVDGAVDAGEVAIRPRHVMEAVIEIRTEKLPNPVVLGNSGSFFKNPVVPMQIFNAIRAENSNAPGWELPNGQYKLAAGWLIDQCGLKGHQEGGVQVYAKQALILVNTGLGTGEDLQRLIKTIQNRVHEKFGVQLEPEPVMVPSSFFFTAP